MDRVSRYVLPCVLGIGSAAALCIAIFRGIHAFQPTPSIQFISDQATSSATVTIDIEGAVRNPGVYTLVQGSRVADAIAASGGLTSSVDVDVLAKTVNRAMKLVDGGKIVIPSVGTGVSGVSSGVSINTASPSDLEALPGVGAVTAQKIISGRPYQTIEELVAKKIVGQAVFEKIRTQLTL